MTRRVGVGVGVGVLVYRNGRLLMGRRQGSHGAGTWSCPGGSMEFGETFEQAAVRELYEEVGLVAVEQPLLAGVTNDWFEAEQKHFVTIWMFASVVSGEPHVREPDKFTDLGWFRVDELPEPLFLPWQNLLDSGFWPSIETVVEQAS